MNSVLKIVVAVVCLILAVVLVNVVLGVLAFVFRLALIVIVGFVLYAVVSSAVSGKEKEGTV